MSADDRPTTPLDATIQRNADIVRRGRRRRDFLKRLGLSVPVTVQDVKQAYYAKARQTHPDHRGDASEFREVQAAFDKALEFAERNGKRLPWIGAQTPIYVDQLEVIRLVEEWGGRFVVRQLDWLEDTIGADFAQLADRLIEIDLAGRPVGDAELERLTEHQEGLSYLEVLGLANTRVTEASLERLARAPTLKVLDLRGTDVSVSQRKRLAAATSIEVAGRSRVAEWVRKMFARGV